MDVMKDSATPVGYFTLTARDANGIVVEERVIKNVVTTAGKTALAARMAADTPTGTFMPYVAVGTGTNAAAASDTQLQTEVARVAGTVTSNTNIYQNVGVFTAGVATGAITEAGLLSAASVGTLFCHQVFAVMNIPAAGSITVTWQVTLS